MRPIVRLFGKCELTVDGKAVTVQIARKHWFVLGLVATSPGSQIGRVELIEATWPLSDDKSRNVLLHMWRRSVVDATSPITPAPAAHINEDCVYIDTTCLAIDYQECLLLAEAALTSDDADVVLQAGTAFDALAEDKILLPSFPSAFVDVRREFDIQRRAVLRRAWQAEMHVDPDAHSGFESRLRSLGDLNTIGEPAIPFKALPSRARVPTPTRIIVSATSRLIATMFIAVTIATPIVLGFLSTTPKQRVPYVLGSSVHKPISDLSRRVIFALRDPDIKGSAATAIYSTPKNQLIAAGNALLTNGDRQAILVLLNKTGKARWVTKQNDVKGITTVPKDIFSSESGRIYVASELIAQPSNARTLAPGSYLAVSVFTRDGQRLVERIHPVAIAQNAPSPIRLISDLKGGVHAFATSVSNDATLTLHVPAGPASATPSPLMSLSKAFRITDAISDGSGHMFLLGYVPVNTSAGLRLDWHIQALDKASKTLWTREIRGAVGAASTLVRGVINADGDLVAYGPLPTRKPRQRGRNVASMMTLSSLTGDIIFRDQFDTENQNPNFALCGLPVGKSSIIAVTTHSPDGSDSFTIHRVGNGTTDTAITITLQFPRNSRLDSIISFYVNNNGALTALLQPRGPTSSNTALTYSSMVFGRGIETGDLSATVPFGYNTHGGALIVGHYDNAFCVYSFSGLP